MTSSIQFRILLSSPSLSNKDIEFMVLFVSFFLSLGFMHKHTQLSHDFLPFNAHILLLA